MKLFSFVHCADLHLDSQFKGIYSVNEEVSSCLREATFDAYDSIIDLCIDKEVDFLIIAGDVYDAGFLTGLLLGRPLDDCLAFAHQVAAKSIGGYGRQKYPDAEDLKAMQGG